MILDDPAMMEAITFLQRLKRQGIAALPTDVGAPCCYQRFKRLADMIHNPPMQPPTTAKDIEHIFKSHYRDLYLYGMRLCGDKSAVQEGIREVFVGVLKELEGDPQLGYSRSHFFISLRECLSENGH